MWRYGRGVIQLVAGAESWNDKSSFISSAVWRCKLEIESASLFNINGSEKNFRPARNATSIESADSLNLKSSWSVFYFSAIYAKHEMTDSNFKRLKPVATLHKIDLNWIVRQFRKKVY